MDHQQTQPGTRPEAIPAPLLVRKPEPQPAPKPVEPPSRILGVDVARGIAIIGMILAHMSAGASKETFPTYFLHIADGRAATLFVMVAGVGVGLLCSRRNRAQSLVRLLYRGIVLFAIGLALSAYSTVISVILQYYCFYLIIAWLGALMPTWLLGIVTPILFVGGPCLIYLNSVNLAVSDFFLKLFGIGLDGNVGVIQRTLHEGLVNGMYPALAYAGPILLGVLFSRLNLRDTRVFAALQSVSLLTLVVLYVGTSFFGIGLDTDPDNPTHPLFLLVPHNSSILTVFYETTFAVFVFSLCMLLSQRGTKLDRAFATFGRMALSVYVFHVILTEVYYRFINVTPVDVEEIATNGLVELGAFLAMLAICFLFAFVMNLVLHKGPIEFFVDLPNAFIDMAFQKRAKKTTQADEQPLTRLEQLDLQAQPVQLNKK